MAGIEVATGELMEKHKSIGYQWDRIFKSILRDAIIKVFEKLSLMSTKEFEAELEKHAKDFDKCHQ